MHSERKRTLEVRMIVGVVVNISSAELTDILTRSGKNPSSVAEVVSSEVVSNLESLPYVEAAIVSQL